MFDVVAQRRLGDITFGVPSDMEELHRPFAYYHFLEVSVDAALEEIKKAYQKLALKLHPDRGGDPEKFVVLQKIFDVLGDKGGELGIEHSRRKHYDIVSSIDSFFDGYIRIQDERTEKLSETLLANMELNRMLELNRRELEESYPEYGALVDKLRISSNAKTVHETLKEMSLIIAKSKGTKQKDLRKMAKMIDDRFLERQHQLDEFSHHFFQDPTPYKGKILDLFMEGNGKITFGPLPSLMKFPIKHQEMGKEVIHFVTEAGSGIYVAGFRQVHLKAPDGHVVVSDPHLVGMIDVLRGSVRTEYDGSSYGEVIRVKSPHTTADSRFAVKDNLVIPRNFAVGRWWEKKPALDIRVLEGSIHLQLKKESVANYYGNYGNINMNKKSIYDSINSTLYEKKYK